MLVLSRGAGDTILIGEDIEILVSEVRKGKVRLALKAPKEVAIKRGKQLPPDDPDRKPRRRGRQAPRRFAAEADPGAAATRKPRRRVLIEP